MSNSLRCYCACSVLVRGALGMTILTTTEKFEFLSIESWCFMDRLKAVSGKPALKGTNLRSCLSCRVVQKNDCPCILLTGFGFVSCLIKGIILLHLRYIELSFLQLPLLICITMYLNMDERQFRAILQFLPEIASNSRSNTL